MKDEFLVIFHFQVFKFDPEQGNCKKNLSYTLKIEWDQSDLKIDKQSITLVKFEIKMN